VPATLAASADIALAAASAEVISARTPSAIASTNASTLSFVSVKSPPSAGEVAPHSANACQTRPRTRALSSPLGTMSPPLAYPRRPDAILAMLTIWHKWYSGRTRWSKSATYIMPSMRASFGIVNRGRR